MGSRQRSLVNRRIVFRDAELVTKYVFPFWDGGWSVRFVLIDEFGGRGPRVYAGPLDAGSTDPVADAPAQSARPLEEHSRSSFEGLYHFDPWWVFRGMGGVGGEYRDAILPTNIARTFRVDDVTWKVHDVEFGPHTGSVVAIEAKDDSYRRRTFTKANLDLAATFGPPARGVA